MKQPHTIDKDDTPDRAHAANPPDAPAPKPVEKRATERKAPEPKPAKFEPKLESKDDHVAHIAELARKMQQTQPGSASFAADILHHVAAIQDPEGHDRNVVAEQRAAFEADALSAKQRGRSA